MRDPRRIACPALLPLHGSSTPRPHCWLPHAPAKCRAAGTDAAGMRRALAHTGRPGAAAPSPPALLLPPHVAARVAPRCAAARTRLQLHAPPTPAQAAVAFCGVALSFPPQPPPPARAGRTSSTASTLLPAAAAA